MSDLSHAEEISLIPPSAGFCPLCLVDLDRFECDCDIDEIMCGNCRTVFFDGEVLSYRPCGCGKIWEDFVKRHRRPKKGYTLKIS